MILKTLAAAAVLGLALTGPGYAAYQQFAPPNQNEGANSAYQQFAPPNQNEGANSAAYQQFAPPTEYQGANS